MDNQEAIETIKLALSQIEWEYPIDYAAAFDMAISALQEQELSKNSTKLDKENAESVQNVSDSDLISRKEAIDALGERPMVWTDDDQYALGERRQYDIDRLAIETLPPAQPETHEERTETHGVCLDTISRQAAIDAIANCTNCGDEKTLRAYVQKHNLDNEWTGGVLEAIDAIEDLPSAQPEIIRCKDCENWIPGYITDNDDFIPPKCGKYQQMVGHNSDDYCSLAERRTDEGGTG